MYSNTETLVSGFVLFSGIKGVIHYFQIFLCHGSLLILIKLDIHVFPHQYEVYIKYQIWWKAFMPV
jgi:hypothetical protein